MLCLISSDVLVLLLNAFFFLFNIAFFFLFFTTVVSIALRNKACTGLPNKDKLSFIPEGAVDS